MTMWPLPENTVLGYKDFCRGCKHCEVDVTQYSLDKYLLSCSHIDACEALYLRITGGDKDAPTLS